MRIGLLVLVEMSLNTIRHSMTQKRLPNLESQGKDGYNDLGACLEIA